MQPITNYIIRVLFKYFERDNKRGQEIGKYKMSKTPPNVLQASRQSVIHGHIQKENIRKRRKRKHARPGRDQTRITQYYVQISPSESANYAISSPTTPCRGPIHSSCRSLQFFPPHSQGENRREPLLPIDNQVSIKPDTPIIEKEPPNIGHSSEHEHTVPLMNSDMVVEVNHERDDSPPDQSSVTISETEPPTKKICPSGTSSDTRQQVTKSLVPIRKNVRGEKGPHLVTIVCGLPSASETDNCLSDGEQSHTIIRSTLENKETPQSTQSFKQEDVDNIHSSSNLQAPKTKCGPSGSRKVNGRRRCHSSNDLQAPRTKCGPSGSRKVNGGRRCPKKVAKKFTEPHRRQVSLVDAYQRSSPSSTNTSLNTNNTSNTEYSSPPIMQISSSPHSNSDAASCSSATEETPRTREASSDSTGMIEWSGERWDTVTDVCSCSSVVDRALFVHNITL